MAQWGPKFGIALLVGVSALVLAMLVDVSFLWTKSDGSTCTKDDKGVCIGSLLEKAAKEPWAKPTGSGNDLFGEAGQEIMEQMTAKNIEENLRYLTSTGHMAGTAQDLEQAEYLQKLWQEQGLDQVILQPYSVQLSHPDVASPNKVYLLDEEGDIKFTSAIMEEPFENEDPYPDSIPNGFLAFAPAGTITKEELVYVNYGTFQDFEYLEKIGISVKDRLVIARYGKTFRGDKVQNAERFNAAGIILYTDPSDYHPEYETGGKAYPHSFWLPGQGIQRGSIVWVDGDPTTPLYPAIDGAYRVPENMTDTPRIPAHCISYNDARKFLTNMGGPEAPEHWKGGMHIKYRLGPSLAREGWSIKLEVNNVKEIMPTYNVIGLIRGSEEPDRYVFMGNHRDSWVFGSCDPSSATAVQMEAVRVLGEMLGKGWRPRRSIVVGSWGAGEYGFYGPYEYIEEYLKVFESRAVAHLNMDLAIIYTYNLQLSASPLLHNVIKEAAKVVPAPDESLGYKTLWEHWMDRDGHVDYNLASTSEHVPFYQRLGMPTSYMVWEVNFSEMNWNDYPLYHTTYENFDAMKFLDPEFEYHLSIGRLWVMMALGLVDSKVLPMDPRDEVAMHQVLLKTLKDKYGNLMKENDVTLEHLENVINKFAEVAEAFVQHRDSLTDISPLKARQLNDQLMQLEKCYIDGEGLAERPHMKNVMFGTDNFNQYAGVLAPGIHDAMWSASRCTTDCHEKWEVVKQQMSVLVYVINSATLMLKDVHTF